MATNNWIEIGGGGSSTSLTIGAFDGQAEAANGLTAVSTTLYAQSADGTHPGMVNTATQTFAGAKTFSTSVSATFFVTPTALPASAGIFRLANTDAIKWRNAANNADVGLSVDASNIAQFTGAVNSASTITGSNLSGTNTGDVTITAVGSSPSANGASFSGQVLTLQPADSTHPGLVTTGNQTWAGNKVMTGGVQAGSLSGNAANTATTGFMNMARAQSIAWRNAGNSADLTLSVDSSNNMTLGSSVQLGAASTTPTHIINSAVNTSGVGAGTLTNVPGSAGNPAGYLTVTINGTTSYIPYFQ